MCNNISFIYNAPVTTYKSSSLTNIYSPASINDIYNSQCEGNENLFKISNFRTQFCEKQPYWSFNNLLCCKMRSPYSFPRPIYITKQSDNNILKSVKQLNVFEECRNTKTDTKQKKFINQDRRYTQLKKVKEKQSSFKRINNFPNKSEVITRAQGYNVINTCHLKLQTSLLKRTISLKKIQKKLQDDIISTLVSRPDKIRRQSSSLELPPLNKIRVVYKKSDVSRSFSSTSSVKTIPSSSSSASTSSKSSSSSSSSETTVTSKSNSELSSSDTFYKLTTSCSTIEPETLLHKFDSKNRTNSIKSRECKIIKTSKYDTEPRQINVDYKIEQNKTNLNSINQSKQQLYKLAEIGNITQNTINKINFEQEQSIHVQKNQKEKSNINENTILSIDDDNNIKELHLSEINKLNLNENISIIEKIPYEKDNFKKLNELQKLFHKHGILIELIPIEKRDSFIHKLEQKNSKNQNVELENKSKHSDLMNVLNDLIEDRKSIKENINSKEFSSDIGNEFLNIIKHKLSINSVPSQNLEIIAQNLDEAKINEKTNSIENIESITSQKYKSYTDLPPLNNTISYERKSKSADNIPNKENKKSQIFHNDKQSNKIDNRNSLENKLTDNIFDSYITDLIDTMKNPLENKQSQMTQNEKKSIKSKSINNVPSYVSELDKTLQNPYSHSYETDLEETLQYPRDQKPSQNSQIYKKSKSKSRSIDSIHDYDKTLKNQLSYNIDDTLQNPQISRNVKKSNDDITVQFSKDSQESLKYYDNKKSRSRNVDDFTYQSDIENELHDRRSQNDGRSKSADPPYYMSPIENTLENPVEYKKTSPTYDTDKFRISNSDTYTSDVEETIQNPLEYRQSQRNIRSKSIDSVQDYDTLQNPQISRNVKKSNNDRTLQYSKDSQESLISYDNKKSRSRNVNDFTYQSDIENTLHDRRSQNDERSKSADPAYYIPDIENTLQNPVEYKKTSPTYDKEKFRISNADTYMSDIEETIQNPLEYRQSQRNIRPQSAPSYTSDIDNRRYQVSRSRDMDDYNYTQMPYREQAPGIPQDIYYQNYLNNIESARSKSFNDIPPNNFDYERKAETQTDLAFNNEKLLIKPEDINEDQKYFSNKEIDYILINLLGKNSINTKDADIETESNKKYKNEVLNRQSTQISGLGESRSSELERLLQNVISNSLISANRNIDQNGDLVSSNTCKTNLSSCHLYYPDPLKQNSELIINDTDNISLYDRRILSLNHQILSDNDNIDYGNTLQSIRTSGVKHTMSIRENESKEDKNSEIPKLIDKSISAPNDIIRNFIDMHSESYCDDKTKLKEIKPIIRSILTDCPENDHLKKKLQLQDHEINCLIASIKRDRLTQALNEAMELQKKEICILENSLQNICDDNFVKHAKQSIEAQDIIISILSEKLCKLYDEMNRVYPDL